MPRHPGSVGGHEVPEQLPDQRHPVRPDRFEGVLGMLRQRAADAADPLVGLAQEEPALAIAQLPQPGRGEGQKR